MSNLKIPETGLKTAIVTAGTTQNISKKRCVCAYVNVSGGASGGNIKIFGSADATDNKILDLDLGAVTAGSPACLIMMADTAGNPTAASVKEGLSAIVTGANVVASIHYF